MSVIIGRNDPCWCKSGRKYKACHQAFDEKIAAIAAQGHIVPTHDIIKNADQIAGIKESCKINIAVLDYIQEHIHEGMNTAEIDKIVYDMTTSMGGIPAPLHYQGYPYSVCTSVNDQVCHGFPSKDVILKSGDIINVDVSTILNGYFSDSSRMFRESSSSVLVCTAVVSFSLPTLTFSGTREAEREPSFTEQTAVPLPALLPSLT